MNNAPAIKEWQRLYEAALEFKKLECWNWVYDDNVFGVLNPENGEIGYCCIMGNLGEAFALAVYLGSDGLEGYLNIQSGKIKPADFEAFQSQKCLMASFEDRDYLQKEDIQIIKKLGLKFHGQKEWPAFRSYLPGYYPWFLTKKEALFLTAVIEQAIDVAQRLQKNSTLLKPPHKDEYLVRVPDKINDDMLWKDTWMKPAYIEKAKSSDDRVDEIRIQKIKKKAVRTDSIWEIDIVFAPTPVREKNERPYFPRLFAVIDKHSTFALDCNMFIISDSASTYRDHFLYFLEKGAMLPQEILVKKDEVFQILLPIVSLLNVKLNRVSKLSAYETFNNAMFGFFSDGVDT